MNKISTSNFKANQICPNILNYDNRWNKLPLLSRFNLDLDKVKDSPDLLIACITYRLFEDFFENVNLTLLHLSKRYNRAVFQCLETNDENIKLAGIGWIKVTQIYEELLCILGNYKIILPNLIFTKAIGSRDRISVESKIDLLLSNSASDNTVDLLTIVPFRSTHVSTSCLHNLDTILSIDYLIEADLKVNKVIELSYSPSEKGFHKKEIYCNDTVLKYVKGAIPKEKRKKANLDFCSICPYSTECSISKVLI